MGEHQKLFPPSLQHVSDVLPEEAHTQSQTQIRGNHNGPTQKNWIFSVLNFKWMGRGDPSSLGARALT